jgi:hypothetical protein
MSGVVIALSSLWRGGMEIVLDVTGNAAHDALGGVLGRTGEWLLLAGALAGWAVYMRRRHHGVVQVAARKSVRGRVARCIDARPTPTRWHRRRHVELAAPLRRLRPF